MATNAQGDLLDGLWILPDGQAFYMDESQSEDPDALPFATLCRLLPRLIGDSTMGSHLEVAGVDVAGIKNWLNENLSPSGRTIVDVVPNNVNAEEWHWLDQLKIQSIRSGLTLIWRGCITTAIDEYPELCMVLRSTKEQILQLDWPPDHLLTLQDARPHANNETCHALDDFMNSNLGWYFGDNRENASDESTLFSAKDGWIYDEDGNLYNPDYEYKYWKQRKEAYELWYEKHLRWAEREEEREIRDRRVETSWEVQLPSILSAVLVFSLSAPLYLIGVHRAELSGGDSDGPSQIFFPTALLAIWCYYTVKRKRTSVILRKLRTKERTMRKMESVSAQDDVPGQGS